MIPIILRLIAFANEKKFMARFLHKKATIDRVENIEKDEYNQLSFKETDCMLILWTKTNKIHSGHDSVNQRKKFI